MPRGRLYYPRAPTVDSPRSLLVGRFILLRGFCAATQNGQSGPGRRPILDRRHLIHVHLPFEIASAPIRRVLCIKNRLHIV